MWLSTELFDRFVNRGAELWNDKEIGLTLQTSTTNNKRVISTFKSGYPHLTLKEGPKVKSDS